MATKDTNDSVRAAVEEANRIFGGLRTTLRRAQKEAQEAEGAVELDVLETAREAGLDIDAAVLDKLGIEHRIYVLPWLPWRCWYPWRPLWWWWWRRYHPWYRYPWWWCGCWWRRWSSCHW